MLGKLSGHSYPARPWYNGQKATFNFGDSLELSFTRWSIFWGVDHPITFRSFKDNVFSFNSTGSITTGNGGSGLYGDRTDPGDRKSNFDFTWRLPFVKKLVTLYADAYSDDDPSPIDAPRRAVWNPGIYFARLPFLQHMDLRVEAVSSQGLAVDFVAGSTTSSTINILTEIRTRVSSSETLSAEMRGLSKAAQAIGFPPAHEWKQATARTKEEHSSSLEAVRSPMAL